MDVCLLKGENHYDDDDDRESTRKKRRWWKEEQRLGEDKDRDKTRDAICFSHASTSFHSRSLLLPLLCFLHVLSTSCLLCGPVYYSTLSSSPSPPLYPRWGERIMNSRN